MADIYKMDSDYLSAESVYDRSLGKTQSEINSRQVLWTNPASNNLAPGNITLSSSDYSYLEIEYVATNGTSDCIKCCKFKKGRNIELMWLNVSATGLSDCWIMFRKLTRNSDTSFTATTGMLIRWGATSAFTGDVFCYPKVIYGIK